MKRGMNMAASLVRDMILSFSRFRATDELPSARSSFRDTLLPSRNVRSMGDSGATVVAYFNSPVAAAEAAKRDACPLERARTGWECALQSRVMNGGHHETAHRSRSFHR